MLISAIIIDDIINNNIISYVINGMLKYYLGYIGYKYIIKIKFLFFFYFFDMPIGTFKIRHSLDVAGLAVVCLTLDSAGLGSCHAFVPLIVTSRLGRLVATTHTYRLKQTVKTGLGTRPYLISFLLVPDPTPEPSTVEHSRTQRPGIRDVVRSPQDRLLVHRRAGRGEGESVLSTYSSRLGSRNF